MVCYIQLLKTFRFRVKHQIMRTVRMAFFPLYLLSLVVGGLCLVATLFNALDLFMVAFKAGGLAFDPPFWSPQGLASSPETVWPTFWKWLIGCGVALTVAAISYAAYTPYADQPNMPTTKIRHCQHCGAALANTQVYKCSSCGNSLPSGIIFAAIRTYGWVLTIVLCLVTGLLLLIMI